MRTILAFTPLWEPNGLPMLYDTKPVLSSSDWYFANGSAHHVAVGGNFAVFADVARYNLKWDEIDPEIDWLRFHEALPNAGIRWMAAQTMTKIGYHINLPKRTIVIEMVSTDYAFPDTIMRKWQFMGYDALCRNIAENIYLYSGVENRKKMRAIQNKFYI